MTSGDQLAFDAFHPPEQVGEAEPSDATPALPAPELSGPPAAPGPDPGGGADPHLDPAPEREPEPVSEARPPAPAPPRPFRIAEPIREGITVLEASAGTGKTHTVASLVVAEVADGRPLDQLLVVTFTRKATGTLRERVWRRLAGAARALAGAEDSLAGDAELLDHLRRGSAAEVEVRRRRLDHAVSTFDTATIVTTHAFCQQVLAGLGVVGDSERDLEVVEDIHDLIEDAVDDLFVRRFHRGSTAPLFGRADARAIADAVVKNPDAEIAGVEGSDTDLLRQRFARTLRDRIDAQKRRGRLLTYDDLLSRLQRSVADPEQGALVVERLRRRFSMAIVDEFQDTDTIQWDILRRAFGTPGARLVLVGDPKQAIYAFRGGDVHTYLEATAGADTRSLDVSWRADQPLLDAVDGVFDGALLGEAPIAHRPLRARPGAEGPGLVGADIGAPFVVRIVDRQAPGLERTAGGWVRTDAARAFIADDVAREAVRLLTGDATILLRDQHGEVTSREALRPGHLAVLVRTNREAEAVRAALGQAGVPAVAHANDDVMASEAADHWVTLLEALEQPARTALARAVALGPFVGWDATRLATASDADWDEVDDRIHDWVVVVRAHGATGLLARLDATDHLSARLLAREGGERLLADLRHVAELLDHSQPGHPTSVATLVSWLREERTRTRTERRRRLESDADAVAVHTIHSAKGLEFPVVLLPSLWSTPPSREDELPVFHDPNRGGVRSVGVGGPSRLRREQQAVARRERDQEELRLLYVALTRARHRVVVWWASAFDSRSSSLARVLLGREPGSAAVADQLSRTPTEDDIRDAFGALGQTTGSISVVAVADPPGGARPGDRYRPPEPDPGVLDLRPFTREFDRTWTRTSYSGLTAAAHEVARELALHEEEAASTGASAEERPDPVVDHDEAVTVDEPEAVPPTGIDALDPDHPLAARLPLGTLPGGPRIGTMVHDLVEHTDFTAPDLAAEVTAAALAAGADRHLDGRVEELVTGLVAAIETPLGPVAGGRRLRDLGRRDRLDELAFDLPLAGGDDPTGLLTMGTIADVFATLPSDDPLAGYHERLRDPLLTASVRGFLTGSIDLVARLGERHLVVDYKTNLLAPPGEEPRQWHFRPAALAEAMADAHYPLQAALYAVALHRYLRWRLPGYDPDTHLGGVAYLFLRGMTGPDVPVVDGSPCGVFGWRPPAPFVLALSDALDRGDG